MYSASTRRRWRLAGDEQVVEALRARRADPALGVGVRVRRAVGRAHDLDPLGREHRVEGRRELGVAIVDEEAGRRARLLQRPGEVARLLGDPGGGRVGGAAGEMDPPGADLEEEQDVQGLEEERLDGEEVAGQHGIAVPGEELPPGAAALAALRCRRHAVPPQDGADRRAPDGVAELGQLALDAGRSPSAGSRAPAAGSAPRSSASMGRRPAGVRRAEGPLAPHELAMPAQHRLRRDQHAGSGTSAGASPAVSRRSLRHQQRQGQPLPAREARARLPALQHAELVPQHHDLEILRPLLC